MNAKKKRARKIARKLIECYRGRRSITDQTYKNGISLAERAFYKKNSLEVLRQREILTGMRNRNANKRKYPETGKFISENQFIKMYAPETEADMKFGFFPEKTLKEAILTNNKRLAKKDCPKEGCELEEFPLGVVLFAVGIWFIFAAVYFFTK